VASNRGFTRIPSWTTEKTCNFQPPVDVLAATEPGSELCLWFEGQAIGVYTIVGMDTGKIEYAIDGGAVATIDPFDAYCPSFHRPQFALFASELPPGKHLIAIRCSATSNEKSQGHALRILKFMAN